MKKGSTIFLQVVIVLIGIGTLALMLRFPLHEGRNAHATLFQVYFNDPFLAYAYTASIAYFAALYQAFKLLGYIGRNKVFSQNSVRALRNIKYCAISLIVLIAAPVAYLFIVRPGDDIAGGVAGGLVLIFASAVIAAAAAVFERTLQSAVDIKSEHDLTV
ncbi:MAG TPA: DUF2975 domain-containing protein [Candidatus Eisenbacteria bacterium]|jgi:hypothetical protein|nr:DUF2975 domain-containing protein [Candidatus Eisenbacteria bacterium]